MKNYTPIKAIRKFCLACLGGSFQEVKECAGNLPPTDCTLWPYRLGHRPRTTPKSLPIKKR